MGRSGKSPTQSPTGSLIIAIPRAWFDRMGLTRNVILRRTRLGIGSRVSPRFPFPDQIRAIAYMEAIALPLAVEDFGEAASIFEPCVPRQGEHMILDEKLLRRSGAART